MLKQIILNFAFGLVVGYLFEFLYRSIDRHRFVKPLFVNVLLYSVVTVLLFLLSLFGIHIAMRLALIGLIPTTVELIVGYGYFMTKGIRLWDYSDMSFNYRGFICLEFSVYWAILSLIYYYFIIPRISFLL